MSSGTPGSGLRARWQRIVRHPAFRWGERAFWIGLLLFAAHRLGPQLSALTGIGPSVGAAPAFSVTTLDGRTLSTSALDGKVVVVNFWATWCTPCRLEVPALQRLHERWGPEGVVVLGLSTDVRGEGVVRRYLRERGVTYPVALATPELEREFGGISAIPTTFVIDRSGRIRHRVFGLFAPPALSAAVRRLAKAAPDSRLEAGPE